MIEDIETDGVVRIKVDIYLTADELTQLKTIARASFITVDDMVQNFTELGLLKLSDSQDTQKG